MPYLLQQRRRLTAESNLLLKLPLITQEERLYMDDKERLTLVTMRAEHVVASELRLTIQTQLIDALQEAEVTDTTDESESEKEDEKDEQKTGKNTNTKTSPPHKTAGKEPRNHNIKTAMKEVLSTEEIPTRVKPAYKRIHSKVDWHKSGNPAPNPGKKAKPSDDNKRPLTLKIPNSENASLPKTHRTKISVEVEDNILKTSSGAKTNRPPHGDQCTCPSHDMPTATKSTPPPAK